MDLTFTLETDGVPTDADAVVLADPTDTYGARKLSSHALLVVAGAAMVRVSEGVYLYDLTGELDEDVEYYVKYTLQGADSFVRLVKTVANPTVTVTGRYATLAGMQRRFGAVSINKWAAVNGEGDPLATANAIQEAVNYADAYIDSALMESVYTPPFPSATQDEVPTLIKQLANTLAGVHLYEAQGVVDFNQADGQPQHRFSYAHKYVVRQLGMIKNGLLRLVLDDGTPLEIPDFGIWAGASDIEDSCSCLADSCDDNE